MLPSRLARLLAVRSAAATPTACAAVRCKHDKTLREDIHLGTLIGDEVVMGQGARAQAQQASMRGLQIPNFSALSTLDIERHTQLLKKLCMKWTDPAADYVLRFTTKSFFGALPAGESNAQNFRKVTLQVKVNDLRLDSAEAKAKFVAMVGPRYTAANDTLKIVSERLPTKELNKAFIMQTLHRLVTEANTPDKA
eukprot:m.99049 g.99049  ORF g.99049 m.99049 type:complete len:195 (-) comp15575_c0_seq1:1260-1844(-)